VAKLNAEQALTVAAVQQLISDWAHELDVHNGLHISDRQARCTGSLPLWAANRL
jgi:hypothetical protein